MLLPLAWMVVTSLRPQGTAMTGPNLSPFVPHWGNYRDAWIETRFAAPLPNDALPP